MWTGLRFHAVWLAFLGVTLAVAPGAAGDRDFNLRLRGHYAFVQTRVCSQGAPGAPGINENLVLLSPNTLRTTALRGVMSVDGQGGGTFRSDELQLNAGITNPGQQQVGGATSTCELSYAVDADGHVEILLTGCTATGVSGVITGQHFTSSGAAMDGQLSADRKTLLLSDVDAQVSTVTAVETGLTSVRVCGRNGTAVRIR